ncbi:MAG: S-methyl-5'-thioadenosine phosphorylase [Candidatus Jordarchaeaceae archaeon]|nr:S-methyl-5'-thioadenosine phosphorylase [Candidatus Jordarchaeia archaeon]MBS7267390.1 S-methyl-5'-thioadenosine phosphorylase [Candidatus Jordarchaeia archaeon]MBS7278695.1 S-methyl-5'-thioadenosine phosphorylase [Candidatus Jordarchaeia archaeon]
MTRKEAVFVPIGVSKEEVEEFLPVEIGILGGTGNYDPAIFEKPKEIKVYTPYGAPSDNVIIGLVKGRKVAFLARHGRHHSIPPHQINYRANIWAFKSLGVTRIFSPAACGSLQPETIKPGEFVIATQIFDRTFGQRKDTFFEGGVVGHVEFADPFCPELRKIVIDTAHELGLKIHEEGTYVCINGPRFSTRAESLFYKSQGFSVVGMTCYPECALAKEAEICMVNISMPTDVDVYGIVPVNAAAVAKSMRENIANVRKLLYTAIERVPKERKCKCSRVLDLALY